MQAIVAATGPSLTQKVIDQCHLSGLPIFGCNLTFKVLNLSVFHACNKAFYDYYWDKGLKDISADKWTWDERVRDEYGVNYVKGIWAPGLSTDPNYIHYHHASSPQLINIALHYGIKKMILVGFDMRYGEKRHFEEYPTELQHFPKTGPNGEMVGLIKEMQTIVPSDYGIEIINCCETSAMKCFPIMRLEDVL